MQIFPYTGSKGSVIKQILPYFPTEIVDYWEPFCGTCSVAYALRDRIQGHVTLSDMNAELIAFLRWAQQDPGAIVKKIYQLLKSPDSAPWQEIPFDSEKDEVLGRLSTIQPLVSSWYNEEGSFRSRFGELRSVFNSLLRSDRCYDHPNSSLLAAALFYTLQRTSANAVYRVNREGQYNVNYGNRRSPLEPLKLSHWERVYTWHPWLQTLEVIAGHHETISPELRSGSLVYLDPPYYRADQNYGYPWSPEDHRNLAHWAASLPTGVEVLVSNSFEAKGFYQDLPGTIIEIQRPNRFGGGFLTEILYRRIL